MSSHVRGALYRVIPPRGAGPHRRARDAMHRRGRKPRRASSRLADRIGRDAHCQVRRDLGAPRPDDAVLSRGQPVRNARRPLRDPRDHLEVSDRLEIARVEPAEVGASGVGVDQEGHGVGPERMREGEEPPLVRGRDGRGRVVPSEGVALGTDGAGRLRELGSATALAGRDAPGRARHLGRAAERAADHSFGFGNSEDAAELSRRRPPLERVHEHSFGWS